MKSLTIFCAFLLFAAPNAFSQTLTQYFDGDDEPNYSFTIQIDSTRPNAWQVGKPQKTYFNAASSLPNVLVTDTITTYPINDTSIVIASIDLTRWRWGIQAMRWEQKLDLESGDGAIIEYSLDSGITWKNVMNNPSVYNFYGYDSTNLDTLQGGEFVFSGTDTSWKDIWLCFDLAWLNTNAKVFFIRFTLLSDSVQNTKEGWMIDNMLVDITSLHGSVNKIHGEGLFQIYPNPAHDIIHIESAKLSGSEVIEKMELFNYAGKSVASWTNIPAKYFVDVNNYANGMYYLKINTKQGIKCYPIVVSH